MLFTFYKYHGTGNDFVIADNREGTYNFDTATIKHLCKRNFGIGADGLMLLQNKKDYDFEMVYYNADGNESSMCGNGGRCLVHFANLVGIKKSEYRFLAIDGEHYAEIQIDGKIRLKMQDVPAISSHKGYHVLNTGSPHYVKEKNELADANVTIDGSTIRYSEDYKQEGINVNFVEVTGPATIFVRTYERGVEAETLSCGTGVTAAAIVCAHNDLGFNNIDVKTLGGKLSVEFEKHEDGSHTNVWLTGPAVNVYKGEMDLEMIGK